MNSLFTSNRSIRLNILNLSTNHWSAQSGMSQAVKDELCCLQKWLKHLELDATWSLSILPVLLIIFQVLDKTLVF